MFRRRRRIRWWVVGAALGVGAGLGAGAWGLFHRSPGPAAFPPGDPEIRIEVLNGCGIGGVGDQVASLLRRAGYRVEAVGNADHFHYHEDIVVARTVPRPAAEAVARALPGSYVVDQRAVGHPYDVTVIVGKPHPLVAPR